MFTFVERTYRIPSGSNTAEGMLSLNKCRCLSRFVKIVSCTFGNKKGNTHIIATFRRVHLTVDTVEQQLVLHILSVCFSLFIQYAMRMRRIVLLSVACPALSNFFHIIQKKALFSEKSYWAWNLFIF